MKLSDFFKGAAGRLWAVALVAEFATASIGPSIFGLGESLSLWGPESTSSASAFYKNNILMGMPDFVRDMGSIFSQDGLPLRHELD